jgi:hypothetical protein
MPSHQRTRKNFKRSIIVARYKHCGGRCEGVLENACSTGGRRRCGGS